MRNPEARPRRRRIAAVVIITALFLGGGGAAYAYWTTTGSGSGTVTAGSPPAVTIAQTSTTGTLVLGGAGMTITGTINNPGTSPVYVTTLALSVTGATDSKGATVACTLTDLTFSVPSIPIGVDIPAGGSKTWTDTIALADTAVNQDACKGANIAISYAAS